MRVTVFVKATASSEAGIQPDSQQFKDMMAAMGRYNAELVKAGIMLDGDGLKPSSKAVRVRFSGTDRTVINGPFAETKELVAGYWLWEVPSMEEAIAWVKKCPNPMPEDSEIEIRPSNTAEDFGEAMTPELRTQEAKLSADVAMRKATVQSYLFFDGCCEEAIGFYTSAMHAKVTMLMRWNESPDPPPPGMLPPGFETKIMHCEFQVGGITLMASDGCPSWPDEGRPRTGFRLALTVPTEALVDQIFNALAVGGRVDMPLAKTFWSPRYGMVTDKFGIGWMVMAPGPRP